MFAFSRPRPRPRPRRRLRLPPGLTGLATVLALAISALAQAPAGATTNPSTQATEAKTTIQTFFDLFQKGGGVMWVLAASSVVALTIVFERFVALRRDRVLPPRFLAGLRAAAGSPIQDREAALAYCRENDSPIARMVAAGIKRLGRGHEAAEKAIEDAGGMETLKLRANIRLLYALGAIATLLGLIGTISGMIGAFQKTAEAGDASNKVQLLSTGIYEAMVCTFGGLAVAILCTVFYYYFLGRVEKRVGDINDELTRFADEFGFNTDPIRPPREMAASAPVGGLGIPMMTPTRVSP